MSAHVIGRNAELASLRDFVASVSDGAAAIALLGEAGVGKTTLWTAGRAAAEEEGVRVLQAQPAESETALSFSGIGDLLDSVLEEALASLPAPQRRALSQALVLEEAEGPPADPRAIGVAVLGALRALTQAGPLVLAIDDVQWLDGASSGALSYAARRLRTEPVGILLARRVALESALLGDLRRSLPAERLNEVDVGPLDPRSLHDVIHEHLGVVLPRPLVAEVHEASGGNPFYALEIVRMLRRSGISLEAGHPLPLPESLRDLVHGRLLALSPACRDYLLVAAALSPPTVSLVATASGVGDDVGLIPALEARVVELDSDRIRFTHPLLATAAYETADPLRRREIHARLAEIVDDPEARGWHLAACVSAPGEEVAKILEEGARHARARGAPRAAALLLERARELTPGDRPEDGLRRTVDAAYLHFEAGDSPRADGQLSAVISRLGAGRERARALVRLARVRSYDVQREAVDLFRQAVDEAEGDPGILAVAHEGVSACLFRLREDLGDAVDHAELAVGLALQLGDEELAAEALGSRLLAESVLGREAAALTAERAIAFQEVARHGRVLGQPLFMVGVHWWWTDRLDQARAAQLEMLQRSYELGDESSTPYVLVLLGQVESALGLFESALARALEGQQLSEQSGQPTLLAYHSALEALVEAQRGREAAARAVAMRALELVPETGGRPADLLAGWALGHLELSLGAADATVAQLAPRTSFVRREQFAEPGAIRFVVDHIEALVELGRRDEATELLGWLEGAARRLERASALAACLRCRGLLEAAAGRAEGAIAAYEDALEWHARVLLPLDRGRTLLALGVSQRRAKHRTEARKTLEDALDVFQGLGAAGWAYRTQAELRRISGRAATPGELTPAEDRVASLVAEGKTNREVAAALFLSERTVEGHLSRVYGKLGVRSRTELTRRLAARAAHEVSPSNTGDSPVSAAPSGS